MLTFIQNTDWAILHAIRDVFSCRVLDFIIPKLTLLGNGGALWIISGVLLLLTKKYRKYGVLLLSSLAVGALIGNLLLKNIVARLRPFQQESAVLLIGEPTGYSFPSGHTLTSVIGAIVLASADRRFGYVAIPLAVLIAFSRLYLFVHFPSDVLCAALLGLVVGFGCQFLFKRLTAPKENAA